MTSTDKEFRRPSDVLEYFVRDLIDRAPNAQKLVHELTSFLEDEHFDYPKPQLVALARMKAEIESMRKDAERLDFIWAAYLKLQPFDVPTGADANDVGWRVINFQSRPPYERVVAERLSDNPRAAIDDAMESRATTPTPWRHGRPRVKS